MNRREFLTTTSAAIASVALNIAQAEQVPQLRELASRKNLLVGSAVSYRELQQPTFTRLLSEQANIVVPENEMKWQTIHPEPERYDFTRADALLEFALQHEQKIRGHNLCWHNQMPAWFAQLATPANAGDLLRRHINAVAGHFAGHIHSWDVVNEAVNVEDGRPDGLRNSKWLQLLGPDYIRVAYETAAKADPKALLTYNDYDIEQDGLKYDEKRKAVLRLLTSMRDGNIPVQALGLQSHLRAGTNLPTWAGLHRFIEDIEKLNLNIFVTELDVDDSELSGSIEQRDEAVARLYRDYLRNVLEHSSVKEVLTWGLTDRDSWLNSAARRHGGRFLRPLLLDSELKPKPAFYAVAHAISAAPERS